MTAIATKWTATADHGDELPSVLTITVREFEGDQHLDIDRGDGEVGVGIWHETQLGELIAGLLAAAKQAGYDMDVVHEVMGEL